MFEIVPFKYFHVEKMIKQPINSGSWDWIITGFAQKIEARGGSVTGILNNVPVVCGGITDYWDGRGQIWSIFDEDSRGNFVPVLRGIKRWLESTPYRRIEMSVPIDFELAHRRARLLGFKMEAPYMEKYLPCGGDSSLYSLVRKDK